MAELDRSMGCGCESLILSRSKIGIAPHEHDVISIISMPTQQYTNTKQTSKERYPLVSIILRYFDQFKTLTGDNLCCCEVKIDKLTRYKIQEALFFVEYI